MAIRTHNVFTAEMPSGLMHEFEQALWGRPHTATTRFLFRINELLVELQSQTDSLRVANEELRQENTRLRKDTSRLDWLSRAGTVSICMLHEQPGDGNMLCDSDVGSGQGKTLREAIDIAMGETK